MAFTLALQAGGQSARMGRDKALVNLGGHPMITWVLDAVRGLGDEVIVTTNRPADYTFLQGVRLVEDADPGAGALSGLRTALAATSHEWVLLLACDMPFVRPGLLEHLIEKTAIPPHTQGRNEIDVIITRWEGRLQPFPAVYHRRCLDAVDAALGRGEMSMGAFRDEVNVHVVSEAEIRQVDTEGLSFTNINTPEQLDGAEDLIIESRPGKGFKPLV